MRFADQVAEIQNTLRVETPVTLSAIEVVALDVRNDKEKS
jgi:hypothetical protein